MKLAASQIAWTVEDEPRALLALRDAAFGAVETVPGRMLQKNTAGSLYGDLGAAAAFADTVRRGYGLAVCSMQSILFGQTDSIFGKARPFLLSHLKRAVLFAKAAGCRNLVFGCPKNRVCPPQLHPDDALPFFAELGDFAAAHGAIFAIEANPAIYGTNFVNTTAEALELAKVIGSRGVGVNLDIGAMVENGEGAALLKGRVAQISHVHLSEPHLVMIKERALHRELAALLRGEGYAGYLSVEMRAQPMDELKYALSYAAEVFG